MSVLYYISWGMINRLINNSSIDCKSVISIIPKDILFKHEEAFLIIKWDEFPAIPALIDLISLITSTDFK